MSPAPDPAPVDANRPLDRLFHGDCSPEYLTTLHAALARHDFRTAATAGEREDYLATRLRDLCRALPPARHLLRDADRLSALLAWTAVADPRLCMTVITHTVLCLGSMTHLGPDHGALEAAFTALEGAEARGSYLVTEGGRANSHLATRTRAVFDPRRRDFVLDSPDAAAAKFGSVPAGEGPRSAVVLARTVVAGSDHGVFPFLVDLADARGTLPGVALSPPLELSDLPLTYRTVSFHGVRVPYGRWLRDGASIDEHAVLHDPLGGPDERLRRSLTVGTGLWGALPSAAAATARQAACLALRHARARPTQARLAPGAPLFAYRGHQRALVGALADAFALSCAAARARELLRDALTAADTAGPDRSMGFAPWSAVSGPLSAYKAHSVGTARRVVADCQRRCGWPGLLDTNRLPGYHGFLRAFGPAGGDSTLILYDIGRGLLDGPADAPGRAVIPPRDPADPRWWPTVLRAHEAMLHARLRLARDHRARRYDDEFELWNPLLHAAGELGETHAARLAATDVPWALDRYLPRAGVPPRAGLEALAALSGVRAATRRAGALLHSRTLRPRDMDALTGLADCLHDRVLPHLPALEEHFGFPDDVAGTPWGALPALPHPLAPSHRGDTT
ncbi:acyl-CoA dehydrogenase family protein [Streptomyces hesseae]|uniref:Acyl-CoA oxidase n=1 Tax=Streptomyces hesseae TaxID=3075519 RepID=A0ABU2SFY2_9ACTN|nr:acyl-CoA oxidase [Streptomyces sp. DSM 40473]MDT0447838.1 acyl-CoA oxidase [Streptomyces sp. DSM 40473]